MDVYELERLLKSDETDRVERTASLEDTEKFSEAICAFANDMPCHRKPGYLFVGACADGSASGDPITDQLLQNLAAIRSDGHIQPLPAMVVQKQPIGGGEIAVIEVQPSDAPPVRYKGRIWIRCGPRRGIANSAEERILTERRIDGSKTWDIRPCREAEFDDLVLDLFSLTYRPAAIAYEIIEENERPIDLQLASLRFLDLSSGCPTNAGVLLFAKDPLYYLAGAYVQFVRYEGESQSSDALEERRLVGDLLSVCRDLDRLVNEVAEARPMMTPDLKDETVFDYPPRAMHELFMNAVIHRNYEGSTSPIMINQFSDRIEILNAGSLYGELTPASFPFGTAYRNPVIAEAARTLGFVNKFGRGIEVVKAKLHENGSPPPEFKLEAHHFLVIVRRRP